MILCTKCRWRRMACFSVFLIPHPTTGLFILMVTSDHASVLWYHSVVCASQVTSYLPCTQTHVQRSADLFTYRYLEMSFVLIGGESVHGHYWLCLLCDWILTSAQHRICLVCFQIKSVLAFTTADGRNISGCLTLICSCNFFSYGLL